MLLCIVVEMIIRGFAAQGCQHFGGYFAKDLSTPTSFIYNQLPIVFSLMLSLLWALPHHDIMRLEPYFQMSKPGGAKAEDSLFLGYSYDYVALVPFLAAKRG